MKKNLTLFYSVMMGAYWMNFAGLLGFSSVYLLSCGLKSTHIGFVVAAACILSVLLQPFVASYADRDESPSLKVIVAVFCTLALFTSVFLPFTRSSALLSGITYGLCLMFQQFLLPFMNSLGTEWISRGEKLNWGFSRGIGSFCYAAASWAVGAAVTGLGVISIPFSVIICFALILIFVLLFPFEKKRERKKTSESRDRADNPFIFIKKYPRFSMVLLGMICLFISHYYLNVYIYQIIEAKGGSTADVGNILALCALLELLPMFAWSVMLKKIKCQTWMKLSAAAMTLKALGSLLAASMTMFYLVQLCQLPGFALLALTPVYYTLLVVDKKDAIKGQAYAAMTGSLGNVFASLTGGRIIDSAGVTAMLIPAVIAGAAGMALYFIFIDNRTCNQSQ
ncbi:MAG: MFS transporter [Lachnospiraceae bacterium]|nr:MFS transporter [Lachnospiraceae bacterium]